MLQELLYIKDAERHRLPAGGGKTANRFPSTEANG